MTYQHRPILRHCQCGSVRWNWRFAVLQYTGLWRHLQRQAVRSGGGYSDRGAGWSIGVGNFCVSDHASHSYCRCL